MKNIPKSWLEHGIIFKKKIVQINSQIKSLVQSANIDIVLKLDYLVVI